MRDVLKQLDEVCKISLSEIEDSREVKLVNEIVFQIYEYLQIECQKNPLRYLKLFEIFSMKSDVFY